MDKFLIDTPLTNSYESFVATERDRYADDHNNKVAFSLGQVGRYVRMSEIARMRAEAAAEVVTDSFDERMKDLKPGNHKLTQEEIQELDSDSRRNLLFQMEVEVYFILVSILLDKTAQCTEDFYGPVRSMTLQSHQKACKHFKEYGIVKNLEIPDGYICAGERLLELAVQYRDKQITHFKKPRALHYTQFHPKFGVQISTTSLYPKSTDAGATSPPLSKISELVDGYISMFINLISKNRGKSRYVAKAGE